ncbi:Bicupin, oxalate decarboxylase/oxidase [Niveomyces insectorum RCEF 264]|uniref:Bicupin, oxalate decarboxylase/oxidase n=1 Tax=Niveomyces insectorum RCEF 264 TaxID=1081102 RepID=A0A167T9U2_9HYPO|nr:Bicupin, oxalate decarboxylase/oxidase [Niveomyces insectorum RCEF 264]
MKISLLNVFAGLNLAFGAPTETPGPGEPISGSKGAPIYGGTNKPLDLQNPDNILGPSTDSGTVPNLKWSFSDSKTKIFNGGWVREQVVTDLPQSHDIAAAQQHLTKNAIRELHWHRVAEWGFVYNGSILISAVDENGAYQVDTLSYGDVWYFPKGVAHTVQGLDDENEYLLAFDDTDFDKIGTTFNIDDWVAHTPRDVLAKNFGVDPSVFAEVPATSPYILNGTADGNNTVTPSSGGVISGNASFAYHTLQHPSVPIAGNGGEFYRIDTTVFPAAKTIAATFVRLKPGGLRELHWHPNAEEWLYFHQGTGRATIFIGSASARTFDLRAGDTAAFPDNSGHYIENTSETEDLVWIELYKSSKVQDISLAQWLALTPDHLVADTLKVPLSFVASIKKEKQVLVA